VTKHITDRQAGIHRKRPHLVSHGRSATHPFETDEPEPQPRSRPKTDVDKALAQVKDAHSRHKHGRQKGK
jgi:hypothetical protein